MRYSFRQNEKTGTGRQYLGATYDVHLRLIGKHVVDFPLHHTEDQLA